MILVDRMAGLSQWAHSGDQHFWRNVKLRKPWPYLNSSITGGGMRKRWTIHVFSSYLNKEQCFSITRVAKFFNQMKNDRIREMCMLFTQVFSDLVYNFTQSNMGRSLTPPSVPRRLIIWLGRECLNWHCHKGWLPGAADQKPPSMDNKPK